MASKFFRLGVASLLVASLFVAGCGGGAAEEKKAPDFALGDIDGNRVSLSDYGGKVVILDFFASWCPPCRKEIPDFIELQKEYGEKGLAMIGISLENLDDTKEFAARLGVNYPVLVDNGRVGDLYGPIRSIPTTFIIDRKGNIAKKYIGFTPRSVFEKDIKALL